MAKFDELSSKRSDTSVDKPNKERVKGGKKRKSASKSLKAKSDDVGQSISVSKGAASKIGKDMQPHVRLIFACFILFGLIAATGATWLTLIHRPAGENTHQTVEIPQGESASQIVTRLDAAGLISSPTLFMLLYRTTGKPMRAGEFLIPANSSAHQLLDILTSGQMVQHSLTIAEGLTAHDAYQIIAAAEYLIGDLPQPVAEGSMAASTFYFNKGDTRRGVVNRIQGLQTRLLDDHWHLLAPDHPLETPQEILILASIIEKETQRPDERRRVAGVFVNRLRLGMRLQSDPTVIYGMTLGKSKLGRRLTRKDLRRDTAHNTYTRDGLPPTPIALPGIESIKAALDPETHDYLYFVADGTGGHAFAKTLREHNRNAAKWRKIRDRSS